MGARTFWPFQVWKSTAALALGSWDPVPFLSKPTRLKTKAGGEKTCNFQRYPKTKLFSDAKCPGRLFLVTKKKNAIIINPNKDTQLASTFSRRFGGRVFTSRQPGLKPASSPHSLLTAFPSHSKKQGLWSMINNMLKLNKKMVQNRNYYHTCPACRINIFNADFRIFSI